jgi:hypothetical protein
MEIPRWRLALTAGAIVVLGAVGIGLAQANGPATAGEKAAAIAGQEAPRNHPGRFGWNLLRRIVHGEAVVDLPGRGLTTVAVDRGTVSAVGRDTISIREKTGQTVTLRTTGETRVRKDGRRQEPSALRVGDEVIAFSIKENDAFVAQRIQVPRKEARSN